MPTQPMVTLHIMSGHAPSETPLLSAGIPREQLEQVIAQLQAVLAPYQRQGGDDADETLLRMIFNSSLWHSPGELRMIGGLNSRTPSASLRQWVLEHKMFALNRDGVDVYPSYAFDNQGAPLPVMADILQLFAHKTPLKIAAWFASMNSWLRDRRPMDMLKTNPQAVYQAAMQEFRPIDHG